MPTSAPKEDRRMAYREVGMMDIDQVIRRWLAGEKIRAIARLTGTDRNMVRRIARLAEETGIRGETPWPDEGKLQLIRDRKSTRLNSSHRRSSYAVFRLKKKNQPLRRSRTSCHAWLE